MVHPMQDDGKSLLDVIDKTVSPMGGRLLRRWLVFPLKDEKPINERLDIVDYYYREPDFRQCIDEQIHRIGDLERIISKVAVGRVSPREVVQLKTALQAIQPIKAACQYADNEALKRVGEQLNLCESLRDRIEKEIQNDPPQLVAKGGVIRDGVNAELDELRSIAYSGKDYLLKIQEREAAETGIASLKIGYNNVFGYYLEVRNTYKDLVPAEWVRKQTLAQAERYITQELKEYEEKILGAEDKILSLEAKLFSDLILGMQEYIPQTGTQYKCEVFLDEGGNPKSAVVFDKTRWYPVDGGSTCCSCSVHRPDIAENSVKLLQAIGWRGYGDVDLIEDPRDGVAKVMEINPRITASVKVCFAAGVDFARQIVELGMGYPVTEYPDYQDGVRLRYMHTDVLWFIQSPNRFKAKPGWFDFRHTTDQIFNPRDPLPWFTYTVQGLRKRKTEMAKRKR